MTHPELGSLSRIDARTVFQNEAQDFTPWLAENLDLLGEALGLDMELVQREMPVGRYSVDIYAKEVGSGREIIVENQLEPTDHGHLGQLLTYAAGLEATVIIWLTPEFRDEHRRALEWLNLTSAEDVSFFGVEIELIRISGSPPAPNFKVVAQQSEWQKEASSEARHGRSERQLAYHDFFEDLVARLRSGEHGFTSKRRVGYDNWLALPAGRTGFNYSLEFMRPHWFRIQLYISTPSKQANEAAFDRLMEQKADLEDELGERIEGLRLDERIACRIFIQREGTIDSPPNVLEELKVWSVQEFPKFKEAFTPRVRALDLDVGTDS